MAQDSAIEWTDNVWNPVTGCTKVSTGCKNCYAETMARRLKAMGVPQYQNVLDDKGCWNGKVTLVHSALDAPLHWRKPQRIFVNSMSDLFHEDVPDEFIDKVFAVMALCPQHTFQVLTKRPERMAAYLNESNRDTQSEVWECMTNEHGWLSREDCVGIAVEGCGAVVYPIDPAWPLPNVHLGISAENQETLDERLPHLINTPAALRFLSLEPLLGPIELFKTKASSLLGRRFSEVIGWVIVGGESGAGARPCNIEWIRNIVAQCKAAGIPCFVKQDSGPKPGKQGRIPDDLWIKEFPDNDARDALARRVKKLEACITAALPELPTRRTAALLDVLAAGKDSDHE